eukprot:SAG25_NODE_6_length_29267_cov_21.188803_7_plen_66_part_00
MLVDDGIAMYEVKELEKAESKFKEALEVWPDHERALEWLENCRVAYNQREDVSAPFPSSARPRFD